MFRGIPRHSMGYHGMLWDVPWHVKGLFHGMQWKIQIMYTTRLHACVSSLLLLLLLFFICCNCIIAPACVSLSSAVCRSQRKGGGAEGRAGCHHDVGTGVLREGLRGIFSSPFASAQRLRADTCVWAAFNLSLICFCG